MTARARPRDGRRVQAGALIVAAVLAAPAPSAALGSAGVLVGDAARTRLRFDPALLASFGVALDPPVEQLDLDAIAPSGFVVRAAGRDFEGIVSGGVRHAGGFTLRRHGRSVAVAGFEIRAGAEARVLEIVDAHGHRIFTGGQMHFDYDPRSGRVRLSEVDLRATPELAARLGAPALAGIVLGRLELEAAARPLEGAGEKVAGGCTDPVWEGAVDVRLIDLFGVQQVARDSGAVAVTLATELESGGTADVPWRRKFGGPFPPYDNDQHPYLVWALYRIAPLSPAPGAPTAIEMLGQSALKHAFFATNADCFCQGDQILWAPLGGGTHDTVPCTDVYGTGSNNDPNALGPRDELEAHSGLWTSSGSFFDQDSDGVCDWDRTAGPDTNGDDCDELGFSGPFDRRLAVLESDLATADATYAIDAWYVVRGDVDIFDTMGWRQVAPALVDEIWTFPLETGLAEGSPLEAWVPSAAPPAGSSHEHVDTGVGHLSLAARATDLGDGSFHYEYALANHDFDRKVKSFRVPLPPGAIVSNAAFRDLDGSAGSDWTITIGSGAVVFEAPGPIDATALDWGTLFNFRFDADAAPAAGSVDLGAHEETPTLLVPAPAITPGGALGAALFFDDFESGAAARWSAAAP